MMDVVPKEADLEAVQSKTKKDTKAEKEPAAMEDTDSAGAYFADQFEQELEKED